MRERVSLLGSEFGVRSRPGKGISVMARLPLSVIAENEQKEERDGR